MHPPLQHPPLQHPPLPHPQQPLQPALQRPYAMQHPQGQAITQQIRHAAVTDGQPNPANEKNANAGIQPLTNQVQPKVC